MLEEELQDIGATWGACTSYGYNTEGSQGKSATAADFDHWWTAQCNPSYQIMEQVKAGDYKDDDTWDCLSRKFRF